jgi:hypothetical protein
VVTLYGRQWTNGQLLARIVRFEQAVGIQLVSASDGAKHGIRLLRFTTGSGFGSGVVVDPGIDTGHARDRRPVVGMVVTVALVGTWCHASPGVESFRSFPGRPVPACGADHTLLGGTDDTSLSNYPDRRTQTCILAFEESVRAEE